MGYEQLCSLVGDGPRIHKRGCKIERFQLPAHSKQHARKVVLALHALPRVNLRCARTNIRVDRLRRALIPFRVQPRRDLLREPRRLRVERLPISGWQPHSVLHRLCTHPQTQLAPRRRCQFALCKAMPLERGRIARAPANEARKRNKCEGPGRAHGGQYL